MTLAARDSADTGSMCGMLKSSVQMACSENKMLEGLLSFESSGLATLCGGTDQ